MKVSSSHDSPLKHYLSRYISWSIFGGLRYFGNKRTFQKYLTLDTENRIFTLDKKVATIDYTVECSTKSIQNMYMQKD